MAGSNVLTTDSVIHCIHNSPPPAGTLVLPGVTHKLTVQKNPVLLKGDIEQAIVSNCPNPNVATPPSHTCMKMLSITAGYATKLTVGGIPVMLSATTNGYTDGYPPPPPPPPPPLTGGNIVIGAVQSKLTAV